MNNQRLYFLDWIRIFAFFVLIFYHTGMYYVTWDWHVKSPYASDSIEPLMLLSSPWRLGLLFMISGVATSFMLKKVRVGALLKQRSWRLLVPLVFGMLVIVPPQSYFEVVEKLNYAGSYLNFMRLYIQGYHGFCKDGHCLDLPTWNHLWFVVYLWAYTMVIGAIAVLAGAARLQSWSDKLGRLLNGWKIIVLPVLVLFIVRYALVESFPATHALVNDWYNHAHYFFLFMMGAMLAMQNGFWANVDKLRWTSLALWLGSWAVVTCLHLMPESMGDLPLVAQLKPVWRLVFCIGQWAPIMAICGFGHRHLAFDSAKRRYLTEAVFPVYILHQTLIVGMAHTLKPVKMAPGVEGAVLIVLTFVLSFGIFEVVRRVAVLRPLFGLGKAPRASVSMSPALEGAQQPMPYGLNNG
jgi:surface polysaccharide O-acyltransferase-like enzyme